MDFVVPDRILNFLNYLIEYLWVSALFLFGKDSHEHLNLPYLVFLISTALVGLFCVALDATNYKITQKSLFNLAYIGTKGTLLMFFLWGAGAGIVGYLAVRLGLIAFTIQASIIVGLGWPLIFPRIYSFAVSNIENIDVEEIGTNEIPEEPEEEIEEEEVEEDNN